ncbi:hypothetical protein DNTS_008906 [Danionella cerebrum]|uniref:Uncharacterized protein n=1 Tax=Danionella cerebrum TaxID=2873325 RepID=A0A553NW88_9TELE|nr:hypothetical protein DNTS_008906 [Danionella translucida]
MIISGNLQHISATSVSSAPIVSMFPQTRSHVKKLETNARITSIAVVSGRQIEIDGIVLLFHSSSPPLLCVNVTASLLCTSLGLLPHSFFSIWAFRDEGPVSLLDALRDQEQSPSTPGDEDIVNANNYS